MSSTGEVACFGEDVHTAYLKAMLSSGFKLPQENILLSIGAYKHKDEMKESVRLLHKMGFNLFGSYNTADYFNEVFKDQNIVVEHVEWAYENIGEDQEVFFNVCARSYTISENLNFFSWKVIGSWYVHYG